MITMYFPNPFGFTMNQVKDQTELMKSGWHSEVSPLDHLSRSMSMVNGKKGKGPFF